MAILSNDLETEFDTKCMFGNREVSRHSEDWFSRYGEFSRKFDPSPRQTIKGGRNSDLEKRFKWSQQNSYATVVLSNACKWYTDDKNELTFEPDKNELTFELPPKNESSFSTESMAHLFGLEREESSLLSLDKQSSLEPDIVKELSS
ncbi:hypothetical protein AVEN_111535-1 [Araneus ventricosus]|uniref:Uncharacterized protein n=1 Tax=Araneus ventricosus TaxID=182803 RepID=A0A4Y2M1E5_ARAVE|nr:hypothetical protein AVEN_111535-1 [Araneus ventricosus]